VQSAQKVRGNFTCIRQQKFFGKELGSFILDFIAYGYDEKSTPISNNANSYFGTVTHVKFIWKR